MGEIYRLYMICLFKKAEEKIKEETKPDFESYMDF